MNNSPFHTFRNKFVVFFSALFFFVGLSFTQAQIISTIAGNGSAGFGGDGSPATNCELNKPLGIAADGLGNIYVSDVVNYRIRQINKYGIINTVAGNGVGSFYGNGILATFAEMFYGGLATDAAGDYYIADYWTYRVRKINTFDIITTVAGNGTGGNSGDGFPATNAELWNTESVAVDVAGNLYLADMSNNRIRKVNTTGVINTIAGNETAGFYGDGGPATDALLNFPNYISVDSKGDVYFTDTYNNRIRKISAAGIISTIAGNGSVGYTGDNGPATTATLDTPGGTVEDVYGNVYIADGYNNRIRMVDTFGIITTIAGSGPIGYGTGALLGDGGPATAAELNYPVSLAMGCGGQLYIADKLDNAIRMISHGMVPVFTAGHNQSFSVCQNSGTISIDTMLAVLDTDLQQTEIWTKLVSPAHGTVFASYITGTTGDTLNPTGLTYVPDAGFTGTDSFKVRVADCSNKTDFTTIYVNVLPLPVAGIISGIDSICPGHTITLSDTATGGLWSTSNTAISTVTGTGIVTGLFPGIDTINYTVTNTCGIANVLIPFKVRSLTVCPSGVNMLSTTSEAIKVYPNPSAGTFTIELPENSGNATIIIMDIYGKIIETRNTAIGKNSFDLTAIAGGTYFIKVQTQGGSFREKVNIW